MASMQEWVKKKGQDLEQAEAELTDLIAEAESELTNRKMLLSKERKSLDELGGEIVDMAINRAGGVKEFGSSEDVRKQRAAKVKAESREYIDLQRIVDACEIEVTRQEDLLSDLNRRFGAICYGSQRYAAQVNFWAAMGPTIAPRRFRRWHVNDAAPEIDVDLTPAPNPFPVNGQAITPEDAEQFFDNY